MSILGLDPVAFAYPGGHGSKKATHEALRKAGFLSARGHGIWSKPFIVSGDKRRPGRWYKLPDVFMESIDYRHQKYAVNDTDDLRRFLVGALDRTAWIILTYHAIGRLNSFGFYRKEHFATDLEEIAKRDFWVASMNDVTLYVYEREDAWVLANQYVDYWGNVRYLTLKLDDGLPDDRFHHPLNVRFDIPLSWAGKKLIATLDNRKVATAQSASTTAMVGLLPNNRIYTIRPEI